MKRVSSGRFALLIFWGFLLASGYLCESKAEKCETPVAKIVSVQGTVEAKSAGNTQWQSVTLNETFCQGDTIRVLEKSRADVTLMNRSFLRINENTTIVLEGVLEEKTSLIDLLKGAAHFLSREPRSLKVKTQYAIFGVRGTEFYIREEEDQSLLSVFEGSVLAENALGSLMLTSGQSAIAEANKAPVLRVVARPRDAVQWALYYPPVMYGISPEVIKLAPEEIDDPRLLAQRAALLLNVGRLKEASADLDRSLRLNADFSDALSLQAIIAIVQNDRDRALQLAQKAVDADPTSATALISLSYAQQARFDLEGARTTLRKATEVAPDNALAWARLAEIQASFGRLNKALDAAQMAESLAPDLSLTQTVLGFAFLSQVKIELSKAAFEKAITLDQAAPLPRLGLGLAKIRQGDLDGGGRDIEIAASLDSANSLIRSYLGKTYYEKKRMPLDEREYKIAKALDPNDPTPWFYDAIAKQTTNRPVEALHNYEKAIELNDNRAVFRSKLNLDSDLAARSAAIARIYNNLGFGQRGLLEGYKSVNTDPTNFSGHRFLADTYATLPRHEIARVSELLQSQLLQPINITPIQPVLAESNLFLISSQGPAQLSFNEFNPLFNRNRAALQLNGLGGENGTWAGEGIASGIYDKLSLSAGYAHFETDGYRFNNDQDDAVANVFAQYEATYKTSLQAEYRHRDIKRGETQQQFFEDNIDPNLRREDQTDSFRFGFRHAFAPNSVLIGNLGYQDAEFDYRTNTDPPFITTLESESEQRAYSGEIGYIFRSRSLNVASGIGYFNIEDEEKITRSEFRPGGIIDLPPPPFGPGPIVVDPETRIDTSIIDRDVNHTNLYLYSYISTLKDMTVTVGASGDFFNSDSPDQKSTNQFNPKFGLTWNPVPNTTLRGAAFRVLKRTLITNQTLEPTQVAGFNQFYDDATASDSWNYGAAVDQKFSKSIYGGLEFVYRDLKVPVTLSIPNEAAELIEDDWKEKRARAYFFWTPHNWLSFTAEWLWERFERDREPIGARDVETNYFPIGINFFHPSGFYGGLKGTYVNQKGSFERRFPVGVFDGEDQFWLVDAAIGYRLPKRFGLLSIGVTNLFDQEFQYYDTDPDNPRFQPARSVIARLTLAFP